MATIAATVSRPHYNALKFLWTDLAQYEEVAFTAGSGSVDVTDTLTQGGVTSTINGITITSGTLGAGTAAGTFKIATRAGGNYGAGAATTTGGGTCTLSGIQTVTRDSGVAVPPNFAEYVDRNVQVKGTPGAAFNLKIEGGRDGVTFATLNDAQGVALDITAVGIKQIQEITPYMRARISAGETDVTIVTVMLIARRERGGQGL